tara:strand:- start:1302 stop:1724 length:423 start_codon:yes stop_codon:yes gene_type:complete
VGYKFVTLMRHALGVMKCHTRHRHTEQAQEAPVGFVVGLPTVAGNTGAKFPKALKSAFQEGNSSQAEFIRLPAPRTRCCLTGLSRTSLNELVESGAVLSVTLRKPGAKRGIKLINRFSLLEYLHSLEYEQMKGKEARHEA